MKKVVLFGAVLLTGTFLSAQDIVGAVGKTKGKIQFEDFRTIQAEGASEVLLSKVDKINFTSQSIEITKICNCGNYIAAMTQALNGDLFYLPMHGKQISKVNAGSKSGVLLDIPNAKINPKDQATFHARMTTTPDGNMYALNNGGTELLRISPNGTVQNLGGIPEIAALAKKLGVETAVYGGDMVADAFGNLYVLSASAHVFKINVNSLKTDYLGKINGLPEKYTVNGAAVEKDGSVLLGTSSLEKGLYSLDIETLEATFKMNYDWAVYDLSSANFLRQAEMDQLATLKSHYSLYPTIVKNSQLNIVSRSQDKTKLEVSVWDLNQKKVYSSALNLQSMGEFQVQLSGNLQPGIYVLKAINHEGNEVINTKFTLVR